MPGIPKVAGVAEIKLGKALNTQTDATRIPPRGRAVPLITLGNPDKPLGIVRVELHQFEGLAVAFGLDLGE